MGSVNTAIDKTRRVRFNGGRTEYIAKPTRDFWRIYRKEPNGLVFIARAEAKELLFLED